MCIILNNLPSGWFSGFGKLNSTLTGIFSVNLFCMLMAYLLILPLHNYIQIVILYAVCWRSEYANVHVLKCFLTWPLPVLEWFNSMLFTLQMYAMTCHSIWYQVRVVNHSVQDLCVTLPLFAVLNMPLGYFATEFALTKRFLYTSLHVASYYIVCCCTKLRTLHPLFRLECFNPLSL